MISIQNQNELSGDFVGYHPRPAGTPPHSDGPGMNPDGGLEFSQTFPVDRINALRHIFNS